MFRSNSPTVRRVMGACSLVALALGLNMLRESPPRAVAPRQVAAPSARWPAVSAAQSRELEGSSAATLPSLAGVVLDAHGHPFEGALVCAVSSHRMAATARHSACTGSGAAGQFALSELPVGRYLVSASAARAGASGQREEDALALALGQHVAGLTLRLSTPVVELAGLLRDAAGGVLAGARIEATTTEGPLVAVEARSDDDGAYRLALPPGRVALRATLDGYARGERLVIAPRTDADLVLEPASSVAGRVVWADDGRPAQFVRVTATGARGERVVADGASGPGGEFRISGLRAGLQRLDAKGAHATSSRSEIVEVELAASVAGVVVAVERGAEVKGRVLSHTGEPCTPGRVALLGAPDPTLPLPRDAPPEVLAPSSVVPQEAPIAADGEVHFLGVPAGRYHVTVQCLGHVLESGPRVLEVDARDHHGLAWGVTPAATLTVDVFDAAGRPLAGAGLALHLPARGTGRPSGRMALVSDHEGRVRVPNLSPGAYGLVALAEPSRAPVSVTIGSFDLAPHVRMLLAASGSLRAEVRSADGAPAEDLSVTLTPECDGPCGTWVPARARPLGAGVYLAEAVRTGRYRVRIDDGVSSAVEHGPLVVAGAGQQRVSLTLPATVALRGQVVDAAGQGLANVWVRALPEGASPERGRPVLSDVDGQFELSALAASPTGFRVIAGRAFGPEAVAERARPGVPLTLTLPEPRTLRGVVVDGRGAPLGGARVWATSGPSARKAVVTSGDDGGFVLRGLSPGPVHVLASYGAFSADELTLDVDGPAAPPLRIRVVTGEALAHAP